MLPANQQQITSGSSAEDLFNHITAPVNHCFPGVAINLENLL